MNNFLVPASIFKLGKFISFTNNNGIAENVSYSDTATNGTYVLAQELDGTKFICKITSNKPELTAEQLNNFLSTKANNNVDQSFELKIKAILEEDDKFLDEIDKIIEEKDLDRKEAKAFEKDMLNEKVKEVSFNEKLIKPGSIVRAPLSSSQGLSISLNGQKFPIFESRCIIFEDGNKVSDSGLYYIVQNRHTIPLVFKYNEINKTTLFCETNNELCSKENIVSLIKHSIRTTKMKNGYFCYFKSNNDEFKENIKEISDSFYKIDKEKNEEKVTAYLEACDRLLSMLEEHKELYKHLNISLPLSIPITSVFKTENSLIAKQPEAMFNIYFKTEDKKTKTTELSNNLQKFINDKKLNVYGFYSILALYDKVESDTYGFLPNNIKGSGMTISCKDYAEFISIIKPEDYVAVANRVNETGYFAIKKNDNGALEL